MTRNPQNIIESTDVVTDKQDTYTDDDASEGSEDEGVDSEIPEEFICPLTLEIYTDPLMSRRGLNFERKAIVEWLNRGHDTCPLTRYPLGYRGLVPNARLRIEVEQWKRKQGYKIKPRDVEAEMKSRQILCMIDTKEATPNLFGRNLRYDGDREDRQADSPSGGSNHSQRPSRRPRRRRDNNNRSTAGLSPATQRRRFITLLGEALNTVRRPSIVN